MRITPAIAVPFVLLLDEREVITLKALSEVSTIVVFVGYDEERLTLLFHDIVNPADRILEYRPNPDFVPDRILRAFQFRC